MGNQIKRQAQLPTRAPKGSGSTFLMIRGCSEAEDDQRETKTPLNTLFSHMTRPKRQWAGRWSMAWVRNAIVGMETDDWAQSAHGLD